MQEVVTEFEGTIHALKIENERWKAYRVNEEENATNLEAKRYKERVEKLEEQLRASQGDDIKTLEELRATCKKLSEQVKLHEQGEEARLAEMKAKYKA